MCDHAWYSFIGRSIAEGGKYFPAAKSLGLLESRQDHKQRASFCRFRRKVSRLPLSQDLSQAGFRYENTEFRGGSEKTLLLSKQTV
jgi:hypothetical protein